MKEICVARMILTFIGLLFVSLAVILYYKESIPASRIEAEQFTFDNYIFINPDGSTYDTSGIESHDVEFVISNPHLFA